MALIFVMGIKLAVDGADLRRPRWTALLSQRLPEYFRAVRELVGAAVSSFHDKLAKELPKATLPSLLFVLSRDLTLTLSLTLTLNATLTLTQLTEETRRRRLSSSNASWPR